MKATTSVTCDSSILEKARKDPLINISAEFEKALRLRLGTTIKDVDEKDLFFKCAKCGRMSKEGFKCELLGSTYCLECHDPETIFKKCNYRDHNHFRIPFTKDRDILSDESINFEEKSD